MRKVICLVSLVCFLLGGAIAFAGKADVVAVKVTKESSGSYLFKVTVAHSDEGWDHYADRWEIRDAGGELIGTRTLHHPHVTEQPFTRSLSGVLIPEEVKEVTVRAHDSVHLFGGKTVTVQLP